MISRTSSALAKRAGLDVRAIGQKLGVDYVLEGTVRRAGDSIRVMAKQLIATANLVHMIAGDTEAAIAWGRKGHRLDPRDPMTTLLYAFALLQGGQRERASALFDQIVLLGGGIFTSLGMLFQHALRGDGESASKAVEEVRAAAMVDEQLSLFVAEALALAGVRDEALGWLENAVRRGLIHPAFLSRTDVLLEDLRADPRFGKLISEVRTQRKAFAASTTAATVPL